MESNIKVGPKNKKDFIFRISPNWGFLGPVKLSFTCVYGQCVRSVCTPVTINSQE